MSARMSRAWAMPSADTFSIQPIRELVLRYLRGVSVDPFARNNRLAQHRNDLNPQTDAESHVDAVEFLRTLADSGVEADVVLLDPPYSPRQIAECYKAAGLTATMADTQSGRFKREVREQAARLVKVGGHVLTFGWNSVGMGPGWEPVEILLVSHGGDHNDTICAVHRKVATASPFTLFDEVAA